MNIRWAQVALSVTFCYGRARGERKAVHMYEDKMEIIHLNMRECFQRTRSFYRHLTEKNYEQRVESGSLKLNFNKDDLNQFDLAGFVSVPEGIDDFLGYVHWMKSASPAICACCTSVTILIFVKRNWIPKKKHI